MVCDECAYYIYDYVECCLIVVKLNVISEITWNSILRRLKIDKYKCDKITYKWTGVSISVRNMLMFLVICERRLYLLVMGVEVTFNKLLKHTILLTIVADFEF